MNGISETLFDRIGGEYAINAAVDSFYERVLSDERINGFFKNISMDAQMNKMKIFLRFAFGVPNGYMKSSLATAHSSLVKRGLNDRHVDVICEHIRMTLIGMGIEKSLIDEAVATIDSYRDAVLGRSVN